MWGKLNCGYVKKGVAYLHMVEDDYYSHIQVKLRFDFCINNCDLL